MSSAAWRRIGRVEHRRYRHYPLPRTTPKRLNLPPDLTGGAEALALLQGLWPALIDAIEPGSTARQYTRRGAQAAAVESCQTCGGPLSWRARTWAPGPHALFPRPADPAAAGGVLDQERLKPYCPACDGGHVAAPGRLPISIPVFDAYIAAGLEIQLVEELLANELNVHTGRGRVLPADAPCLARLEHIERLMPVLTRPGYTQGSADTVTRMLLAAARAVQIALRDTELVVQISGRCPHCRTRALVMYPDRGDINARLIDGAMTFAAGLIQCTYRECQCTDQDCRCHARDAEHHGYRPYAGYRHEWPNGRWAELGDQLGLDLDAIAKAAR